MVRDFDMGKDARLANGKVLSEWEIVAEDTIACQHSVTGAGRSIAAGLPTARRSRTADTTVAARRWRAKLVILTWRILPVGL